MSLSAILTSEEQLLSVPVLAALRQAVSAQGAAVLLVPSFSQALDAQRQLAREPGLALGVTTTTLAGWVRERWEVWGDGRRLAGSSELVVLAREVLRTRPAYGQPAGEPSLGVAHTMVRLVDQAQPWLPADADGCLDEAACTAASLMPGERRMVALAGRLAGLLHARGYVSAAEAMSLLPQLLGTAGVRPPAVVVAGFTDLPAREHRLLEDLSALTDVTVVGQDGDNPVCADIRALLASFGVTPQRAGTRTAVSVRRDGRLEQLREQLFTGEALTPAHDEPVELLLAAGPVAEAGLVAERVAQLVAAPDAQRVAGDAGPAAVIVVPDVARARRELVPKLVARGLAVRLQLRTPLLDCPAGQAFFAFAEGVARLAALDVTWPDDVAGIDGPLRQLGDMSWWPPRDLSDFLLSDVAHLTAERGWLMDARWRGNRLLTPAALLASLQSERDVSAPVARATQELLRGRIGSAASKLLAPYVEAKDEQDGAGGRTRVGASEEASALQAILTLAGTLHELGVTADPAVAGAVSLQELVACCRWAAEGITVGVRELCPPAPDAPCVWLVDASEAARLAPCSTDILVVCGLTTDGWPVAAREDLASSLLDKLGIEPAADAMARARLRFRAIVGVPAQRLVLERALHDEDAKEAYPAVMLTELLAAYGISAKAKPHEIGFASAPRVETALGANLAAQGVWPKGCTVCSPAPAGLLTEGSRGLVLVPQDGSVELPDGRPYLSASQIETYLDCPYKWFSLRRLGLGQVDAGHSPMEMGTFAHRVMEVTHRELLLRALEAQRSGFTREELLAQVEADPVPSVPGSRVDAHTLQEARALLDQEFELHRQHMYMVRRPKASQQLLVAHDSIERAAERRLREDLLSALDFEASILEGFEPRFFEWRFGRRDSPVPYAGAYFVGTIDRIDVNPHGAAVIIDYKHKSPWGFNAEYDALQEGVLEGSALPRRVQSLIYAQVVRRAYEGRLKLVGTVYLGTKGAHALAGAADENLADRVFGNVSKQRAPRVSVPRTEDGQSGMAELLDRTEELVAKEVEQMLAGNIEARPRDAHSCDFCPVMRCERRVAR